MSQQSVVHQFPVNHPFRTHHAALRTRALMVHALMTQMYSDYNQMNPLEVQTALVSLKSLFADSLELVTQMAADLDGELHQQQQQQMAIEKGTREELHNIQEMETMEP